MERNCFICAEPRDHPGEHWREFCRVTSLYILFSAGFALVIFFLAWVLP